MSALRLGLGLLLLLAEDVGEHHGLLSLEEVELLLELLVLLDLVVVHEAGVLVLKHEVRLAQ